MGYGDMFSAGFFGTLLVLAATGLLAIVVGTAWLLYWLATHLAWVS